MTATMSLGMALAAAAVLSGCGRAPAPDNSEAGLAIAAATPDPKSDPYYTDATMNADEVLRRNDLAIAENKRLEMMLTRHQGEDPDKFERIKDRCAAAAHGLSSVSWRQIDRCVEVSW